MMNTYEPPLEPYCDYDPMDDWVHVDELDKYDDAEKSLKDVINHLYNTGDVEGLEDSLEELASVFDINLPNLKPKLIKKDNESYDFRVQFITNTINLPKIIGE